MSGFGEVVSIIGLTNIALHHIHRGFVLLRTAHNFGEDADRYRRSLEWEHYRYCVWEEKWNDLGEPKDDSPPLSAKKSMAAQLVQELTSIFPGGEKLEQRYKLKIEPSDEDIDEESARGVLKKFTVHLRLRKDFGLATANAIHSQSGRMKRWRWAIWDKDRMKEYIEYVTILVSRLLELTALDKPSVPEPALESMIRKAIKTIVEDQDLHFLKTLHYVPRLAGSSSEEPTTLTLPDLKATRLEYKLDQVPSVGKSLEISETRKDSNVLAAKRRRNKQVQKLKLKSGLFHTFPTSMDEAREVGSYMGEMVVLAERKWSRVEGKAKSGTVDERLRHRIEGLVVLLSQLKGPSFHALSLHGYFEEQDSVAFVYHFPQVVPAQPLTQDELAYARVQDPNHILATNTRPHILTVHQMVGSQLAPPEPSTRLDFGRAMAETVLELHTAGWLHKAIRTDNILLCNLDDRLWPHPESFQGPFLAGYMFARENDPREMSDEIPSSPETDLYRHPSALGEARLSFRPEFDLYALGMALLEIGLWKNLKEILPTIHEKLCLKHRYGIEDVLHQLEGGKNSITKQLHNSNSRNYCEAVFLCLKPQSFFEQQSSGSEDENDDENLDNSVRLQETVLAKLKT